MSTVVSQSSNVSVLLAELLTASKESTREWLRAEMDRTVDPMLHSIFNRLTTKLSSQSQSMTIKEEIETITNEPIPTHQIQPSSYEPVSNEQSNHKLTDQHSNNNEEWDNSQINLPDTEMRPQQLVHIKHNQFDDQECDCGECDDGGIEVKEEDDDDNKVNNESSRPVKRPRLDTTRPKLAQPNRHLQCSHCHKSFDHNSKLHSHLRVHTGERPFQCNHCDKRFTQKVSLESHQRIHSGERPFACRHCEKSFTTLAPRIKHEQAIHLHVKPYRCKQCGHTATTRSTIITHVRIVHFGLPQIIKQQRALNIIDDRDPREWLEKV